MITKLWGIGFFLLVTILLPAIAQTAEIPGFDPLPVQIGSSMGAGSRPITSMDLLTIKYPKGVALSPDGKHVAFVLGQAVYTSNSYRSGIFVVDTKLGSLPIPLGTAGLPRWDEINQWSIQQPQWSKDSRYITYVAKMETTETWQVWRWDIKGGRPVRLTHVPGDVQSYRWSDDGCALIITSEIILQKSVAEAHRKSESGFAYDGSINAPRYRPVLDQLLSAVPLITQTWIHDLASSHERKPTQAEEKSSVAGWIPDTGEQYFSTTTGWTGRHMILDAKISPDHRMVAYRTLVVPTSKSVYRLFLKPVHGGKPIDVAPGAYAPFEYWWSADSSKLYYVIITNDGHPYKLMAISVSGGTPRLVFHPPFMYGEDSSDRSGRYMACSSEDPKSPGRITLVDLSDGSSRTLVDFNPEFRNIALSQTIRLDGVNTYGDYWFAHLVKPANYQPGRRYPLIVTTYTDFGDGFPGGGSGNENPIGVYAAQGFAVLSYDMGSRASQVTESWFISQLASIEMAVQQGADMGIVDTSKMGLTGYSRGMEIVGYVITHSNIFTAVSGAAGDNGPYFYYMAPAVIQDSIRNQEELGGWPEDPAVAKNWKAVSSYLNADRIHAAVLNNDPDSEFLDDLALYTSMKELRKPMDFFIYPNELHEINQPKHRFEFYTRNDDWFRFWLQGYEDPDPAKAPQYKRWEELRKLL